MAHSFELTCPEVGGLLRAGTLSWRRQSDTRPLVVALRGETQTQEGQKLSISDQQFLDEPVHLNQTSHVWEVDYFVIQFHIFYQE